MKKLFVLQSLAVLSGLLLISCGRGNTIEDKEIVVGADVTPHALILEVARSEIEARGYTLKVVSLSDWTRYNPSTLDNEFDANYFQHSEYLDSYLEREDKAGELVSALKVHYEHFGIYVGTKNSIESLVPGDSILVPLDTSNQDRALRLLIQEGLATIKDDNTNRILGVNDLDSIYRITPISAELIAANLSSAALGVINCNYALNAYGTDGINSKVIALETSDQDTLDSYGNIVAVKKENLNSEAIRVLVESLKSDKVSNYITTTFGGVIEVLF